MQKPKTSIVLIGMMGAGKSSVGALVHQRIGLRCCDIDHLVEEKAGRTITQIFASGGEEAFRELEAAVLAEFPRRQDDMIITGGGIVLRPENRARLKQLGPVVWLDADEDILFERATANRDRPLLKASNPRKVFADLYRQRQPLYAELADLRIDTSSATPAHIAAELVHWARHLVHPEHQ